ncbi:MAG: flagellar hook-length control protein FliK [Defluviitaleaceae bacterium]|nr:flagellar hook-length control protein FliK [Defluviitaleaceae bacterium]
MINDIANHEMGLASSFFKVPNVEKGNASGQSFGQLMSDMDVRETTPVQRERNNSDRNNRMNERDNDRTREASRRIESGGNAQRESRDNQTVADVKNEEISEVIVNTDGNSLVTCEENFDEIAEIIVDEIATMSYVPQEVVLEYLHVLEMNPEDIAEPQNANKFLQSMLKVESPVELLVIPEYPEALKEIVETVKDLLENGEMTKTAKPNLDKLFGLKVEVDDQNQLVVSLVDEKSEMENLPKDMFSQLTEEDDQSENFRNNTTTTTTVRTGNTSYDEAEPVFQESSEFIKPDTQSVNLEPQINPAVLAAQQATVQATIQQTIPTRVDPAQVMEQILSRVKTVSVENFAELRINLRPEHLGDVSLRIATQNGTVAALFVAENQRIKEIIESQFNQLKAVLAEQGIEVSELFVSVNSEDSERQMNEFLKAQQEALRRLQRAAGLVESVEEETPTETTILMDNTVDFSA